MFPTSTDGSLVAVVVVEPIDVPPCMSGGSVFERVSGKTVPVTDPAVLRSLFARGEAARESAAKRARSTAADIYVAPHVPHEAYRMVVSPEERS